MRIGRIHAQPVEAIGNEPDAIGDFRGECGVVFAGVFDAQYFAIHAGACSAGIAEELRDQDFEIPLFESGGDRDPEGERADFEIRGRESGLSVLSSRANEIGGLKSVKNRRQKSGIQKKTEWRAAP